MQSLWGRFLIWTILRALGSLLTREMHWMARVMRCLYACCRSLYAGHSIKARYYIGAECIFLSALALRSRGAEAKERCYRPEEEWWLHRWIHTRTQLLMLLHIIFLPACVRADLAFIGCVGEELLLGRLMRWPHPSVGKRERTKRASEWITLTALFGERWCDLCWWAFFIWAWKMFT